MRLRDQFLRIFPSLPPSQVRPKLLVLNVPLASEREAAGYHIPPWLEALAAAGDVRIERTRVDYGPGTKLIPTVRRAASARVARVSRLHS